MEASLIVYKLYSGNETITEIGKDIFSVQRAINQNTGKPNLWLLCYDHRLMMLDINFV